ncbi:hypothetical protein GQ43DRAFT_235099 [Delitschia confertaspora ATCC 74209]|uniref:Uncharacterized protein n=1 Tax=Delitschia confertaspora ATCC 74209 TaxID=1513339 RepID=A0A9P4JGL8_9PLEO|nr:hypothetical protein GQ43DRAFT_235099 [Delitschia confertaspora ATCC 74209]
MSAFTESFETVDQFVKDLRLRYFDCLTALVLEYAREEQRDLPTQYFARMTSLVEECRREEERYLVARQAKAAHNGMASFANTREAALDITENVNPEKLAHSTIVKADLVRKLPETHVLPTCAVPHPHASGSSVTGNSAVRIIDLASDSDDDVDMRDAEKHQGYKPGNNFSTPQRASNSTPASHVNDSGYGSGCRDGQGLSSAFQKPVPVSPICFPVRSLTKGGLSETLGPPIESIETVRNNGGNEDLLQYPFSTTPLWVTRESIDTHNSVSPISTPTGSPKVTAFAQLPAPSAFISKSDGWCSLAPDWGPLNPESNLSSFAVESELRVQEAHSHGGLATDTTQSASVTPDIPVPCPMYGTLSSPFTAARNAWKPRTELVSYGGTISSGSVKSRYPMVSHPTSISSASVNSTTPSPLVRTFQTPTGLLSAGSAISAAPPQSKAPTPITSLEFTRFQSREVLLSDGITGFSAQSSIPSPWIGDELLESLSPRRVKLPVFNLSDSEVEEEQHPTNGFRTPVDGTFRLQKTPPAPRKKRKVAGLTIEVEAIPPPRFCMVGAASTKSTTLRSARSWKTVTGAQICEHYGLGERLSPPSSVLENYSRARGGTKRFRGRKGRCLPKTEE